SEEAAARATGAGAAEVARGDVLDAASLARAAAGCALIYHLAGTYRGSAAELRETHVGGTANVLAGAEPHARVVYVSSTSVYGWDRLWPADHDTPPRPASAYGEAKLEAEGLVRAWDKGPAVIVRPTITYGVGDEGGMLARVHRLLRRGVRVLPGTGDNRIHLTHVDDLVAGMVLLGEKGDGVFVLAGPEAAPTRRIFGLLAEGAGLPAPSFGVPAPVLRPMAAGMESVWSAFGREGEPPLNRHAVDVATRDRAYDAGRAVEVLGWRPQVTLDEGVREVGRWLASSNDGRREAPAGSVASVAGNVRDGSLGFDWRAYVQDPDEGLGTVYERFALRDVLKDAIAMTGSESVLHAPQFGMMGFPGLDAVFCAREGIRVGLLDFDAERLDAVVAEWRKLGLDPAAHLVSGPDPATWPERLDVEYDLVFSFAALWWFEDPWAVLATQARWAGKAVLSCVPNKNVFMRMRARLWHQDLFERLNEDALDAKAMTSAGEAAGLRAVDTGLFDIPPFPDTSVPLAKVLRAALGKKSPPAEAASVAGTEAESGGEGAWAWSILPYLHGEQPDLEERIARLSRWERYLPAPVAPALAHHRYVLFVDAE
ncbi:MAG TPA: NAD-dependent epimerase/dehydratase family protein, partial [Acidimicrobiales bacterium]|nr:NAD-dependent epimerase/dehydratase family protein [Acidimicrobiales bacterium]